MIDSKEKRIEKIRQKLQDLENETSRGEDPQSNLLASILNESTSKKHPQGMKSSNTFNESKTHHRESKIGNSFYNEALQRREAQARVEEEINYSIKAKANRSKVTKGSIDILKDQTSRKITESILEVDRQLKKELTLGQVGRVLTKLSLFDVLKFDEDFQVISHHKGPSSKNTEALTQDLVMHQILFAVSQTLDKANYQRNPDQASKIPSENDLSKHRDYVWADNLFLVLNTLMSRFLSKDQKIVKLMQYLMGDNLKENSPIENKPIIDQKTITDFKSNLHQLYYLMNSKERQRLPSQSLRHLSPAGQRRLTEQKKDLSFRPNINEKSVILDQQKTQTIVSKISRSPSAKINRIDLMNFRHQNKQAKVEFERQIKEEEEQSKCTFKPHLNHARPNRSLSRLRVKSPSISQRSRQQLLEEEKKRVEEERLEKEIVECTFNPKLTSFKSEIFYRQDSVPRNYEKVVGRMRSAFKEKMDKKDALERIPRGETYEYWRNQPISPPRCALNYKVRSSEPFITLKLKVSNDRIGTMALRIEDDPVAKARYFAVAFQLPLETEKTLIELIKSLIDKEINKILKERPLSQKQK